MQVEAFLVQGQHFSNLIAVSLFFLCGPKKVKYVNITSLHNILDIVNGLPHSYYLMNKIYRNIIRIAYKIN